MRKGWLWGFVLLLSVGFVSSASLSELLNELNQLDIFLFVIFIVAFSLLFFALNKVFKKQNTAISGIIAVAVAFLITFGISKSGFDLEYSLLNIGISSEALGIIVPLIIVGGIVFLIVKLAKDSLLVIGGLFILASFFVYTKLILIVIGAASIVARILIPKGVWNRPQKPNT